MWKWKAGSRRARARWLGSGCCSRLRASGRTCDAQAVSRGPGVWLRDDARVDEMGEHREEGIPQDPGGYVAPAADGNHEGRPEVIEDLVGALLAELVHLVVRHVQLLHHLEEGSLPRKGDLRWKLGRCSTVNVKCRRARVHERDGQA